MARQFGPRGTTQRALVVGLASVILASNTAVGATVALPAARTSDANVPAVQNTIPGPVSRAPVQVPVGVQSSGNAGNGAVSLRNVPAAQPAPKARSADQSRWGPRVRAYDETNGTITLEYSATRENYRDASGRWQPIDTTLVTRGGGAYDLATRANDVALSLSDQNASAALAQVQSGGYVVRFRAPGYGAAAGASPTPAPSPSPTASQTPTPTAMPGPTSPGASASPSPASTASAIPASTPTATASAPATPSPSAAPTPSAPPAPSGSSASTAPPASSTPSASPSATPAPSGSPTPAPGQPATTQSLAFPGARPGDTLNVVPTADGFEFGATLSDSTAPATYTFALDTGGLTANLGSDGQSVLLSDPKAAQATDALVGRIGAPGLTDAAGVGAVSGDVTVAIVHPGDATYPSGVSAAMVAALGPSEVLLVYSIRPSWLHDSARTYPVVLDPSVCIQQGGSGCTSGYIDTFVMSTLHDRYPTGWTVNRLGTDAEGTGYGTMRDLLYFPDVTLEDGGQVTSATLDLHQTKNDGTGSSQVIARRITSGWSTTSTWDDVSAKYTTTHQSPAATVCGAYGVNDCTTSIDVRQIVEDWYTRRGQDWQPDLGFMLFLSPESNGEIRFDNTTTGTVANRPKLTINYPIPHVAFDFAPELGPNYAPSAMPAGQTVNLPIVVSNNGSGFTFNHTNGADLWRYRAGYRWLDPKGNVVSSGATDLPADLASGTTSSTFVLAVTTPSTAGLYTLRLDLVHALNGVNTLWASDWAQPSLYNERDKRSFDPANTRWTGGSAIERDEFPINVLAGGGTAQGATESVTLGDGSTVAVNLWSRDFHYEGSGGIGFTDLQSVGLSYGWDQAYRTDCSGILGACGWFTNYDERLTASSTQGAYTYQDPKGNRYLVGTDANGQLISGAPISLQRPRSTLFDDNRLAWTSAPAYDTNNPKSGSFSTEINSGASTQATLSPSVPLNVYQTLNFSARATSSSYKGGLALQLKDESTGVSKWIGYGFGPAWTIPGMDWQTSLGASSSSWTAYSAWPWNDANNNRTLFGTAATGHDQYTILTVELIGGTSGGYIWFDAATMDARSSPAFRESLPTFTANGTKASLYSADDYQGSYSIKIAPANVAGSPIVGNQSQQLWIDPFVTWAWRKVGGTSVAQIFTVTDVRDPSLTGQITYYAGANKGYEHAIKVSDELPTDWTVVTRDLEDDARQLLGQFDDKAGSKHPYDPPSGGPVPDEITETAYELVAFDGQFALFDEEAIESESGMDPVISPGSEDFVATYSDGSQHYFNVDGLLERIVDRNGAATTLDWSYNTQKSGQVAYTLQTIHAPGDGLPLSSGTAQREMWVATDASTVKFTEHLGSTASSSGRYTEFDRTIGGDLSAVVPARRSADCAVTGVAPGLASGCLKFEYSDSSNHYLWKIRDPRDTGPNNQYTNNDYTTLQYWGSDPSSVVDSETGQAELQVLSYATSSPTYTRVLWQDQPALEANDGRYVDLTPDGSTLQKYVPKSCVGTCTVGSTSTYPASPTNADLMSANEFDGIGHIAKTTEFETAGAARVISRRSMNASLAVDNLNDPLTAAEVTWSQSPDQYFASHAAGNDDLYRTTYTYNGLHEPVDVTTPEPNPSPAFVSSISGTTGFWRLQDPIGSTTAADSSGNNIGQYSTLGCSLGQPGPLLPAPTDKSVGFDGQHCAVTLGPGLSASTTLTIEAWIKPDSGWAPYAPIVDRSDQSNNKQYRLQRYGSTNELEFYDGTNATHGGSIVVGAWNHVAAVVTSGYVSLYVNGVGVADGVALKPLSADTPSERVSIGGTMSLPAQFFDGSIAEVAIYTAMALGPATIARHWAEGIAVAYDDVQTLYDSAGNPTSVTDDTFLANQGFEYGSTGDDAGWSFSTGASIYQASSPGDAHVHSGTASLQLPPGAYATQIARLVPGQAFRFQLWADTVSSGHIRYRIDDDEGSGWHTIVGPTVLTPTSWKQEAVDFRAPAGSDGRLKVTISNDAASGTGYADDVDLLTTYSRSVYSTGGAVPAGLPTDTYVLNQVSNGDSAPAEIRTHLDYAPSTLLPAILPMSTTTNYVDGTFDPTEPAEDVTSTTSYDAWGRQTSTVDADGVSATTTYDGTNKTDVASTADGLGNTTLYEYDAVGNRTSVTTPLSEKTTTKYTLEGDPAVVTGPAPWNTKTQNTYSHGLLMKTIANYVDGTPSGPSGSDDVTTSYTYDAFGNVLTTISDDGTGLIRAKSAKSYDLLGNVTAATTYADTGYTQARTTTAYFDTTGSSPTITRPKPTGSRGPINSSSGYLCPSSTTILCNTVSVLDIASHPATTYDAYKTPTAYRFDLDDHQVRTTADYVDGTYSASYPDQDVTTDQAFDLNGGLVGVTDVLGHVTSTERDALGRATRVVRADGSWTRTDYTPAGRTSAVSRIGAAGQVDSDVAWTKTVYDAAGRATATLSHWDRSGNAQLQLASFESGSTEGFSGSSNWAVNTPASITPTAGTVSTGSANTGFGALALTSDTARTNEGASLVLSGTFVATHTYWATVYAKPGSSGQAWQLLLGASSSDKGTTTVSNLSTSSYTAITTSWTPSSTYTSGVRLGFQVNHNQTAANSASIDDVEIWDAASPDANIPSITAYDADSHPVASILPGGAAGESPLVTRTAYDSLGRTTDVTVAAIAGTGTSAADTNLVTHTDYDALGRVADTIDPLTHKTAFAYDRLGHVTATTANYLDGVWSSANPDQDVKSTFAYDAVGELTGYCTAQNRGDTGTSCDPTNASDAKAWHYGYDAGGHLSLQTPPAVTLLPAADQLGATAWTYDAGSRLTQVCNLPRTATACSSAIRYTATSYDKLGRATQVSAYTGTPDSGTLRLAWTTTLLGDGFRSQVAFDGTGSSPSEGTDTVKFTPDTLDRVTAVKDGSNNVLTGFTYNTDDTVATRTDPSGTTSFGYDWAGRPNSTDSPLSTVTPTETYRLDGLVGTRTWIYSTITNTGTFSYDRAKRPLSLAISGGTATLILGQSYDRGGNVMSESRTFNQISGDAGTGTQTFTYDGLDRVKTGQLNANGQITYAYDRDGNRTSVVAGGVTTAFAYDVTDQLYSEQKDQGTILKADFDGYGNMTKNPESYAQAATTAYAYDTGDRLLSITPPAPLAKAASFTYDALGRMKTRSTATSPTATLDTYSYMSTTETVTRIVTTGGSSGTVDAILGADGSRLATQSAGLFRWLIPDLHGSVAAAVSAGFGSTSDAFRYDAYGNVSASLTSTLPTPWRYQGRLLVDPAGATDLYGAGARLYSPGLGVFTQLDSYTGSAQDPASMNRYLYAQANPTTLTDPSGHYSCGWDPTGIFMGGNPQCDKDTTHSGGNATSKSTTMTTGTSGSTVRKSSLMSGRYYVVGENGVWLGQSDKEGNLIEGHGFDDPVFDYLSARCDDFTKDDPECSAITLRIKKHQADEALNNALYDEWCGENPDACAFEKMRNFYKTSADLLNAISVGLLTADPAAMTDDVGIVEAWRIRFSQNSVNDLGKILPSMEEQGWNAAKGPIDVVRMPDDNLTAMTGNTRLAAARIAGKDVEVQFHNYDEGLTELQKTWFTRDGQIPQTWGEAVKLRIMAQTQQFGEKYPFGSFELPRIKS